MESFLTTLPPYVHQYINKYPPTECFNVLKDLICFAVLYSNDHERINLLSLELFQKGADNAVTHKPYTSSELGLSLPSSASSAPSTAITSPIQSTQHLSPPSINKTIPSPSLYATHHHHSEQLDLECRTIMEEPGVFDEGTIVTPHVMNETVSAIGNSLNPSPPPAAHPTIAPPTADIGRKSTMPYTFPEWWAHPDSDNKDHTGRNTTRSISPATSSNELHVIGNNNSNPSRRLTATQEMNITNWVPIDFEDNAKKPTRSQTTGRPVSLYNPTIPDLRSYLGRTEQTENKKQQTGQANETSKITTQISAAPACDPIVPTISKSKPQSRQSLSTSRSSTPRLLTRSISSKTQTTTTTTTDSNNSSKPSSSATSIPLSRSSSTRSTASSSTTTSSPAAKAYRPGQTATVRARAEQAKQRQLQLEEEKRKQAAASTLTSRTSLRLRQQAASGIDWDSIKKERRKTMPASGL